MNEDFKKHRHTNGICDEKTPYSTFSYFDSYEHMLVIPLVSNKMLMCKYMNKGYMTNVK